jgi:pyruvate-formate lyase
MEMSIDALHGRTGKAVAGPVRSTRKPKAKIHRLSAATHELAGRAMGGEWGRSLADPPLTLEGRPDLMRAPAEIRYAHAVRLVAESAPIRIVDGERVVGSATLKLATRHFLPVYSGDKPAFHSISHTTLGFDHVLQVGYRGLREEIAARQTRGGLDQKGLDLLQAMELCLDAAAVWHRRHLETLDRLMAETDGAARERYERVHRNLKHVPEHPPTSFPEAVQSLWFMFSFQRLCGNWPGIGRIDEMLGPFLSRDLADGRLMLDEAREILAHFWIKGCDWVGAQDRPGSGDGQFYQNIILAGVDVQGREIANEVTELVLDVIEELRIADFPVAVRINGRTPESLLRRIAEVQRLGSGAVAIYNEDLILSSLVSFGYPLDEARRFANDGCWEIQVPGRTRFRYVPFSAFLLLQDMFGVSPSGEKPVAFETFEDLYEAFRGRLAQTIEQLHRAADKYALEVEPAALAALFTRDCIERGRGYTDGGARYAVCSIHAGGVPDAGNSLLAIRKLVYEERRLTLLEFIDCLRQDWAGNEALRRDILTRMTFFGNDDPEADAMTRRVFDDFLELVGRVREREGVLRPPGISTFGREVGWRSYFGATAHGQRAGAFLAPNLSPTPGTDRKGPTAVVKSHCSLGLERLANGTALDLKMLPSAVRGETGLQALVALMRTFIKLGGIFLHVNVVDNRTLREARAHPERHAGLTVRVSGWSARFATLNQEWQDMIINRTEYGLSGPSQGNES